MAPFGTAPDTGVVFAAEILIVANRHHDAYARHARTISDLVPGFQGPLAGISAALTACATPWLLTLPVDCPQPPPDLAARLLAGASQRRAAACVAHDGQRRQPLFAVYRRELADSAAAGLTAEQGVSWWQDSIGVNELDFADRRRQFRNLNTPEDFAAHAAEHRSAT
jgi:molybdopterin-guanine dinucleotide biosynthesis protein A